MTKSETGATDAQLTGNPLLDRGFRPRFQDIRPEHVVPGIRQLLEEARAGVEEIASDPRPATWATVLEPLDQLTERVREATVPIHHLLAVAESEALRQAWAEILPEKTRFWSWLHLHPELWRKLKELGASAEAAQLDELRARHLDRTLKDFRRAGADLDAAGRARLEELDVELAQLQQTFSENVLDATQRFSLTITDPKRLEGIPEDALARFRKGAEAAGEVGWRLTVDQPSFDAVLKHAEDRSLREELHRAYFTRGMEEPGDNRPLIGKILRLRQEKARLLGYADFPDYRLEEQMVRTGARARDFVAGVTERTRPYWKRDLETLASFAEEVGIRQLEPWDVAFLVERIRREKFDLDEEALRPYFPLPAVLDGLFEIARRLFGLRVSPKEVAEVWHPDVRYYELFDEKGTLLGGFYTDFFPRPEKRQGAWMNDFVYGGPRADGSFAPHLGLICANVAPAAEGRPALLTHNDVETLFHEFGHLLHHLTSRVPIAGRGGINVAWDWVELPSQLLENWTWERAALDLFARHWQTGEPLPDEVLDRMLAARKLMGGWRQMRQLSFGTLDLALHTRYDPDAHGDPVAWVSDLLEAFTPSRRFAESHPLPSFMHIFSGGYAASYYSYLWSEVLEADLFSRFREAGIFDRETGREYMDTILSAGDRAEPDLLFRTFMGRDPDPEALIARNLGELASAN
jgi:oligopeptidase A